MPNARTSDPTTSHEAARSVWEPTIVQQRILDIIDRNRLDTGCGGMSDEEMYAAFKDKARRNKWVLPTEQSIRSRRHELVERGILVPTGLFALTTHRRRTQKWGRP